MFRLPVKHKGKPLMPMKSNRVTKFVKEGKGRIRYDRKLKIHYLEQLHPSLKLRVLAAKIINDYTLDELSYTLDLLDKDILENERKDQVKKTALEKLTEEEKSILGLK